MVQTFYKIALKFTLIYYIKFQFILKNITKYITIKINNLK